MGENAKVKYISAADYVVFGVVLIVSGAIGVYFRFAGGKQKTTQEYLFAGRSMSVIPVAFSTMATFKSAVSFIGIPSEIYLYGPAVMWQQIWQIPGAIVAGYLFYPAYFDLQCSTSYEFLRRRFGPVMRLIGSLAFIGQMVMLMSVVLYAPALSLSAVTSTSIWISIASIGVICTLYCTLGGMKAVLWTDAFQAVLMYIGLIAMLTKGILDLGGIENVFRIAKDGQRFQISSFELNLTSRYDFWNGMCQGFFLALASYGCSQVQVQRALTVKDVQQARRALFLSVAMSFTFVSLLFGVGIVMYAHFYDCDPLLAPEHYINKHDQLLPYYVMILFEKFPGLPGLCISSVFCASLSTVSSAISSLAAVTIEDFILPICGNRKTFVSNSALFAKIITFAYGVLCTTGTLVVAQFDGIFQACLTIVGTFSGPLLGVFFLGMFTATANEMGVVLAALSSIAVLSWISFGAAALGIKQPPLVLSTKGCPTNTSHQDHDFHLYFFNATIAPTDIPTNTSTPGDVLRNIFPLYKISFMWIIGIGFILTVIAGWCFSRIINTITGTKPVFEAECLTPIMRIFLLPKHELEPKVQHNEKKGVFVVDDQNAGAFQDLSQNGIADGNFDQNQKIEKTTKF